MSTTGAGDGGGDVVQPAEGAPAAAPQQADTSGLEARMAAFEAGLREVQGYGERFDSIEQVLEQAEADEQDPEAPTPGRFLMDPTTGEFIDRLTGLPVDEAEAMSELGAEQELGPEDIQRMIDERVAERVGPIEEREHRAEIATLEEKYPQLREQDTAAKTAELARQLNPERWRDAHVLENAYLALRARERAEEPGEDPDEGQASGLLENPAAVTGGAEQEPDEADRIVGARRGAGFWM